MLALGVTGCGKLGNPLPLEGSTEPAAWTFANGKLVTRTITLPVAEAKPFESRTVDHRGPTPPNARARTLVTVRPQWTHMVVPARLRLRTAFALRDGGVVEEPWTVTGYATEWKALFDLADVPVEAVTRVE